MRTNLRLEPARAWAVLALALFGCPTPTTTDAGCPTSYCNSHGACAEVNYLPQCACDDGYSGLTCLACEAGYHRVGTGTCVLDDVCGADTCGPHGTCAVVKGVIQCTCAPGYDGPRCDACYGDFIDVSDAGFLDGGADGGLVRSGPASCVLPPSCTPGSCGAGFDCDDSTGAITCTCAGTSCAANDCTSNPCGAHGTCDTDTGAVRCTCAAGYAGAGCASCAIGFHAVTADAGVTCALNERCSVTTCGTGACALVDGVATCTCDASTEGAYCETCASGFHRVASGACEADQACTPTTCGAHATCAVVVGLATCPCDRGYAGSGCAQCAPGFHRVTSGSGFGCELDVRCAATSCGGGTCEDGTGVVVCSNCPTGFTGQYCQVNVDDCGTACNGGQCIDLVGSRVCLCTDGTWGQACLAGPVISQVSPPSGPRAGGTVVTLSGSGFVAGSTVTFNGQPVTANIQPDTSLSFTTPPGNYGAVPIVVRGLNGQSASASFAYGPLAFGYSGGVQRFTVPPGLSELTVHAWGAAGGGGRNANIRGGAGGHAAATFAVDAGQVLFVVVGQGGARFVGLDGGGSGAGAGGGLSGVFLEQADGGFSQATALVIAGGGGGGGFFDAVPFGSSGGNGGGALGGAGAVTGTPSLDARGLGGAQTVGGIGGCSLGPSGAQCGQNGAALVGGGGGNQVVGTPRPGATFGGGGGVGIGSAANAGGGGGGWWGGGGGANETAQGGGGGSGYVLLSATNPLLERGTEPGVPPAQAVVGYRAGVGVGGHVLDGGSAGGNGLVLLFP